MFRPYRPHRCSTILPVVRPLFFVTLLAPPSFLFPMATLTDKTKLRLASQWTEVISQLGSASMF